LGSIRKLEEPAVTTASLCPALILSQASFQNLKEISNKDY
jgi:hypothetical protein